MNYDTPIVYAVKHKDETVRAASRSGGVFTALSDQILSEGGVIYGCILDEEFNVRHIRAVTEADRDRMRGSKYVQSDLRGVFVQIKKDLLDGRKVLFSGTSCQVAGLKGFLGKDYNKLICVDIVCHGVPSPLVFHDYLEWQKQRENSDVIAFDFRNKRDFGWAGQRETLFFSNGQRVDSEVFKYLFASTLIERPSCYRCPYKSIKRVGNITIADYWGIDQAAPGFNDNKGVSLVLVNNDKGSELFEQVKDTLELRETRLEDSMQPALQAPFPSPENRDQFWTDFQSGDFSYIAKKYGTISFMIKLKKKIRLLMRVIIK